MSPPQPLTGREHKKPPPSIDSLFHPHQLPNPFHRTTPNHSTDQPQTIPQNNPKPNPNSNPTMADTNPGNFANRPKEDVRAAASKGGQASSGGQSTSDTESGSGGRGFASMDPDKQVLTPPYLLCHLITLGSPNVSLATNPPQFPLVAALTEIFSVSFLRGQHQSRPRLTFTARDRVRRRESQQRQLREGV